MKSEKLQFANTEGQTLVGRMDVPKEGAGEADEADPLPKPWKGSHRDSVSSKGSKTGKGPPVCTVCGGPHAARRGNREARMRVGARTLIGCHVLSASLTLIFLPELPRLRLPYLFICDVTNMTSQ